MADSCTPFQVPRAPPSEVSCVDSQIMASARQGQVARECNDDMTLAVQACSPQIVCPLLQAAKLMQAQLKKFLPNVFDLKDGNQQQVVQKVLDQMNDYENFVVDFISESSEFTEMIRRLMLEQWQLQRKTGQELQRARKDDGWDRSKIRADVEGLRKEVNEVVKHVQTRSSELLTRLQQIRGDAITKLLDMLNGAELADSVALEKFRQKRAQIQETTGKFHTAEVGLNHLQNLKEVKTREISATEAKLKRFIQKADHLQLHLDNLASQSFEKFGLYLQALQQQQDLFVEPEEEDGHLTYLRCEIRKAEQDLAMRANDSGLHDEDADALNHFILIIETTSSFSQDMHNEIVRSVRGFAQRRLDAGCGSRDRVSVVAFHYTPQMVLFNRSWSEFLRFQFTFQRGNYCRYSEVWSLVRDDFVNKVQAPNPGQKINTVFMFIVSAKGPNDAAPEDICTSVKRCVSQASLGINAGSGFALCVGETDVSVLGDVVKALNSGSDTIADETGHTRSLLQQARDSAEIMPRLDEMVQWMFGKQPDWKKEFGQLEFLKQLYVKQENKGQERLSCAVKRTAEALRLCEQIGQDERKTMQEEKDNLRSHLQTSLKDNKAGQGELQKAVDKEHIDLEKLEGKIRQQTFDLAEVTKELEYLEKTHDTQKLTDLAKETSVERDERFVKFSPKLADEGQTVKMHLNKVQVQYRHFITGFSTALKALSNSVTQLEQAVDEKSSSVTSDTSTIKVLNSFFQEGVGCGLDMDQEDAGRGEGLVVSYANWKRILKSICPESDEGNMDLFADIMEMEDFITETCLDRTGRAKMQEVLEDKLRDKLAERKEVRTEQGELKSAKAALKGAKAELTVAEANVKAAVDANDDKDEIKEKKEEEKTCRAGVKDAEKVASEASKALDIALMDNFEGVLNMLNRVSRDLRNRYQRVVLNDGADRCESALKAMNDLFCFSVKNFCDSSSEVSLSFIEDKAPLLLCDRAKWSTTGDVSDSTTERRGNSQSGGPGSGGSDTS